MGLSFCRGVYRCVFVCLPKGQEAALYTCVCILFVDLSSAGAFTLQRTKAMFTITADFIWLMHCHGCRLGQVLLVIKRMCWLPPLFFSEPVMAGGERRRRGCRDS